MAKKAETKALTHKVEVSATEAGRIVHAASGVLVLENNRHQYQKGDLIRFDAVEDGYMGLRDSFNPIHDQIYEVDYVYSGRGIEPGFVVVSIHYKCAAKEEGEFDA